MLFKFLITFLPVFTILPQLFHYFCIFGMLTFKLGHLLLQHSILFKELFDIFEIFNLHFDRKLLLQSKQLQLQHQLILFIYHQALLLRISEHHEELFWGGDKGMESRGHILFLEPVDEVVRLAGVLETDVNVVVCQFQNCVEVTNFPCGLFYLHYGSESDELQWEEF